MSGRRYFKERLGFLLLNGALLMGILALLVYLQVNQALLLGVACIWCLPLGSYMILEYLKYVRYYKELDEVFERLDQKYLLPEVMTEPEFEEGRVFFEMMAQASRQMHEQVKYYENQQKDYKEYIESWIHEIKTPIASAQLVIENNPSPATYKLDQEMRRVALFVEQALYYARSNEVNQDYMIKPFALRGCVMKVVKDYSRDLIHNQIAIEIGELGYTVHSDSKWIEFMIGQIIGNSIKYAKDTGRKLGIDAYEGQNQVVLRVRDNGIGIDEKDLRRVFDKGFTGENGRKKRRSTGIGLYLCKKLCSRLGIGLKIDSKLEVGTTVELVFPVDYTRTVESK